MEQFTLQSVAAIFVIFAISRVYLRFKERKISTLAFSFWIMIWIAGVWAILDPDSTTRFARLVGIGRGVDAILYASIVVIFYLIFRIYVKIEDTQRNITDLTRKIALDQTISKSAKKKRK